MKKIGLLVCVLCLLPLTVLIGQQNQEEKADPLKNLSLVDETVPVPENVNVGFFSIKGSDAVAYLRFISDDLLEGRDTATEGYSIAAHYAATMFELWGLKPLGDPERPAMGGRMMMMPPAPASTNAKKSFFQNIPFKEIISSESSLKAVWKKGDLSRSVAFYENEDYTYYASETQSLTAPVVFVGYGIQETSLKFDDYKNIDVKGKFVLMLSETPRKDNPESPFNKGDLKEKYYPPRRFRRGATDPKAKVAMDSGAAGILMVQNEETSTSSIAARTLNSDRAVNDERPIIPGNRRRMSLLDSDGRGSDSIPTIQISRKMADALLGFTGKKTIADYKTAIEQSMKSQSTVLPGVSLTINNVVEHKLVNCMNVIGYIEGTDPELKKEAVVIGSHLDHLGKRGDYIYNGADDDGSGSVGVREIAEAFMKNPVKTKRSIVFALWTGEEKGLLGSRFYVDNSPIKTYANINLDMISREYKKEQMARMARLFGEEMTKEALEKINPKKYVSLSYDAKTPAIGQFVRTNNTYVGLHINISASETASGGSDHAPFAQKNIPWSFFIAAMTEDYHQPSDTVDKVSSDLMEKIMRIAFLTAFDLANN
ncbi:MAG: M20/M25/M40 family metallo-hydrolase [Candidatus Aminicenantes bacterium]|nr:M20/M25/M40 family metallo-hydrolase [Candidatus Aminicenantes bacterium]